jgi:hypothetical protein
MRMVTFTASEVPQITSCSVLVYYEASNPQPFFFTNNDGCELGSNFGKRMVPPYEYPNWVDTIKVTVPANTTQNDYFATDAGLPRSKEWNTGPSDIWLNVIKQVNPDSLRVRLLKVDDACGATLLDSTAWTAKQSIAISRPTQNLAPDALLTPKDWDSTGSGTKLQMITDATDGNYIFSTNTDDSDYYSLADFNYSTYEFGDVIDSLKLWIKAQDNGTGTTRIIRKVVIGSDTTSGATLNTTTSWVDYSMLLTTPPGSRGTWDAWEVDSVRLGFISNIGASDVRITNCSTVVYITKAMVKVNIDNHNWATGNCNERLQVQFEWSNPAAAAEDTIWFRVGSEAQSRIDMQLVQRLSPCGDTVALGAACVTQDSIAISDTVLTENQWTNVGGASKVASITDAVDANSVTEVTQGQVQRFTFANQSLPAGAIIDSIRVESRGKEYDAAPTSPNKYGHRLRMDGNTNYCDGPTLTGFTSSYVTYANKFTGSPSGAGVCYGIWSAPRLDSSNLQFNATFIGTGDTIFCTFAKIYICYTVPPACEFRLHADNSNVDDAYISLGSPTTNFGTAVTMLVRDTSAAASPILGQQQILIKWDALKDSIVNRTVASATLEIAHSSGTSLNVNLMNYIRGLRKGWAESQVTWNNCSTGVAWTTAGAGSTTNDRYTDILDSFKLADTSNAGYQQLDVTSYLQLCDGSDTANYKGWIITAKSQSASTFFWQGNTTESTQKSRAPRLTVNYCSGGPATTKRRRRMIQLTPSAELETSGADKFADAGDFSSEIVTGFIDNDWVWGEPKEWTLDPKVRVEITDEEIE